MEPKSSTPRFEHAPLPTPPEANGEVAPAAPEYQQHFEQRQERGEQRADAALAAVQSTAVLPVPVPVAPPPAVQADDTATAVPTVAADEDLIEKEWVDKAKQIINQTKDDPYRREQEVGKLQAEYLRKRYGRELGGTT